MFWKVGAMMKKVMKSASESMTWLEGCWSERPVRKNESTMMTRTNEVIMISSEGATLRMVKRMRS